MATCVNNTVDSNLTGLSIAEEECLKELPAMPVWYGQEPNSYSDFGGDLTNTARAPIDPSRQNKKGSPTDVSATGGFNTDVTPNNLTWLMQGFMFADARQPASTQPFNAAGVAITEVLNATKRYTSVAGLDRFAAGDLILASGFANASNNGLKTVAASAAGYVEVAEAVVAEVPGPFAKLETVGKSFAASDVNIAVTDGIPSLVSTAVNFTTIPSLFPGKWVFIGGDGVNTRFANNVGYARIRSVTTTALIFDDTTFLAENESGAGKSIRMFSGVAIRNEKDRSLIKRRSYQLERYLGESEYGTPQAEYIIGAVPNEFTLTLPEAEKLTADFSFVACDTEERSGNVDDEIKAGSRVDALGEGAYNSTSHLYRIKLALLDPATASPTALFGYVTDGSINIANGVTPNKALGVFGAMDMSTGNFTVTGSLTAYFTTVAAVRAMRNNADVGLSVIAAMDNHGLIFDMPLVTLAGGRNNVEKDSPIMLPLDQSAVENKFGYTLMYQQFVYLPNVAMPR